MAERPGSSEATHRSEVAARYQEEDGRDVLPRTREEARDVNRYDIRRVIGGLLAVYGAVLFVAGFFTSALVGYFTIRFLLDYLTHHSLRVFAYYRFAVAAVVAVLLLVFY